jgi:hypothetical protein
MYRIFWKHARAFSRIEFYTLAEARDWLWYAPGDADVIFEGQTVGRWSPSIGWTAIPDEGYASW